ncbi:MAG: hypothetical protein ACE5KT_07195 [Methanosarcinales archaeon]
MKELTFIDELFGEAYRKGYKIGFRQGKARIKIELKIEDKVERLIKEMMVLIGDAIIEGIDEGEKMALRRAIINILKVRFGENSIEIKEIKDRLKEVKDISFLEEVHQKALKVNDLKKIIENILHGQVAGE